MSEVAGKPSINEPDGKKWRPYITVQKTCRQASLQSFDFYQRKFID